MDGRRDSQLLSPQVAPSQLNASHLNQGLLLGISSIWRGRSMSAPQPPPKPTFADRFGSATLLMSGLVLCVGAAIAGVLGNHWTVGQAGMGIAAIIFGAVMSRLEGEVRFFGMRIRLRPSQNPLTPLPPSQGIESLSSTDQRRDHRHLEGPDAENGQGDVALGGSQRKEIQRPPRSLN